MTGPLSTTIFTGQTGHAAIHNEDRQAIDDLQVALTTKAPVSIAWTAGAAVKAGQLVSNTGLLYTVNADGVLPGSFTTTGLTAVSASVSDASPTGKGAVQLVGDLGGSATAPTTPTAVHLAGTESVTGAKTFTVPPTVPTPTATGHATTKAYVDGAIPTAATLGLATAIGKTVMQAADGPAVRTAIGAADAATVSTHTTQLATYAFESVTIPAQAFVPLSATQVSTQTVAGILKSNVTFDKGLSGAAIGLVNASGVPIPADWVTFAIKANFYLFGAAADTSTNTARMGLGSVQHDDSGTTLAAPTITYQNVTLPVGSQQTVSCQSGSITRTNGKCVVYVARDAQAAVAAGDTFGSRVMLVSADLVRLT